VRDIAQPMTGAGRRVSVMWAMCRALLAAGHPITVWNRTAHRVDDLVRDGAVRADTITEAVRASELVIVCVLDYAAVRDALAPAAAELAGRTVVNLTNGTPAEALAADAWVTPIIGAWAIVAPWIVLTNPSDTVILSNVIVGAVIVVLGLATTVMGMSRRRS